MLIVARAKAGWEAGAWIGRLGRLGRSGRFSVRPVKIRLFGAA